MEDHPLRKTDRASSARMPVLFLGHGDPMNAITDNVYSLAWTDVGRRLPRPQAILCISAHWETAGTWITAAAQPPTVHDFYGFPQPLYEKNYPAPGEPKLARRIAEHLTDVRMGLDRSRGLDHGVWSVMCRLFPDADIPVLQVSLDAGLPPAAHYRLGRALRYLRREGVILIGSGNMVHHLGMVQWQDSAFDWALEADARMKELIVQGDHQRLIDYPSGGRHARMAIPTTEHFLPLLYVLAMAVQGDRLTFFCESVTLGAISMRSLLLA